MGWAGLEGVGQAGLSGRQEVGGSVDSEVRVGNPSSELPPAVASWQPYKRLVELSALVSGNLAAA